MRPARTARCAVATGVTLLALAACSGDDPTGVAAGPTRVPSSVQATTTEPPVAFDPGLVMPSPRELEVGESHPVEDPYYPETSNPEVDVLHYFLDLDWDGAVLHGTATVTFRAAQDTAAVRLDLADALRVGEVQLDGTPIAAQQRDDGLIMSTGPIELDSVHTLTIPYSGSPETTPAPSQRSDDEEGIGWSTAHDGSVHTFEEPYGAFTWFPVNDHPSDEALYDASITTYDADVAVFNGELTSSDTEGDATTSVWHLDEPVASYLTTIAIGPYVEHVKPSPDGMPISYWVMDRDTAIVPALAKEGGIAVDWLVDHAGPYPFSTLGVVVVGGTSAMESQTMITMSRTAVERSDAVLEHEMAHQWFGDSVSPRDWQAMWLNEGWAMYMQQWYETDVGRRVYAGGLDRWRPLDEQSRRVAGPPGDYDPRWFADLNVYLGPAMMLDRIRQEVGDEAFEQLVKDWAADQDGATVDRGVFETWLDDVTGEDFSPLVARWLDSTHTPR